MARIKNFRIKHSEFIDYLRDAYCRSLTLAFDSKNHVVTKLKKIKYKKPIFLEPEKLGPYDSISLGENEILIYPFECENIFDALNVDETELFSLPSMNKSEIEAYFLKVDANLVSKLTSYFEEHFAEEIKIATIMDTPIKPKEYFEIFADNYPEVAVVILVQKYSKLVNESFQLRYSSAVGRLSSRLYSDKYKLVFY
jgi:hypothetical protein